VGGYPDPVLRGRLHSGFALGDQARYTVGWCPMSKKTKKKKARMRRSKANHGKRPNMGR
jgi:hypothetical protein